MSLLRSGTEPIFVSGPAGRIEAVLDAPAAATPGAAPRGIALVAHPHPLYGGTLDNKVVQTLARTFAELGYVAVRPNFRGVGQTEGSHDKGEGETDDLLAVLDDARRRFGSLPVVLAGFSFGGFVQTRVARRLSDAGDPAKRLVLVAPAVGRVASDRDYRVGTIPADTILIHGDQDTTVPLANVRTWAEEQGIPVHIVPDADHFFHRKLGMIKSLIKDQWH